MAKPAGVVEIKRELRPQTAAHRSGLPPSITRTEVNTLWKIQVDFGPARQSSPAQARGWELRWSNASLL